MQEKDIFDEKQETKRANYACPHCREREDYDVRWLKRTKKRNSPRNLNEQDRRQLDLPLSSSGATLDSWTSRTTLLTSCLLHHLT